MKFRRYEEDPSAPGYLRRRLKSLKFFDALQNEPSVENLEAVIAFILEYTVDPEDPEEAREKLLDLNAGEYSAALQVILQSPGDVDPEADGDSDAG